MRAIVFLYKTLEYSFISKVSQKMSYKLCTAITAATSEYMSNRRPLGALKWHLYQFDLTYHQNPQCNSEVK